VNRARGEKDTDLLATAARNERQRRLRDEIESIYDELTDGLHRPLRVSELVYAAGERYPNLVPTRAAIEAERQRPLKDRLGLEIDQVPRTLVRCPLDDGRCIYRMIARSAFDARRAPRLPLSVCAL